MTRLLTAAMTLVPGLLLGLSVHAGPEEDRKAFLAHYQARFPDVPFAEYANGIYAIDEDARRQWQEIEEFPPYEFAVEEGEALWNAALPGNAFYADCFPLPLDQVRASYPRFDEERDEVVTLELALNDCRQDHGAERLAYDSEELISITAYLAFMARGKTLATRVPGDQPGALAAYEAGKRFYYSKRGQLNFACADCHVTSAGQYVRADRLGPSLGHPTHFPVYRSKLGAMITLQQRFAGCVRDVRAKPFELQSREYRNLEYFLSYMSNGLELNGPGARK
jgi:L-cysteine S-thiosulfotransferase